MHWGLLSEAHSWLVQMMILVMASWPAVLGRYYCYTSVTVEAEDRVIHTTEIRWLGVPLLRSKEVLTLTGADAFTLQGTCWMTTMPLRYPLEGNGTIDPDAAGGEYILSWLGAQLVQTTRREGTCLRVEQLGQGYRASLLLKRIVRVV